MQVTRAVSSFQKLNLMAGFNLNRWPLTPPLPAQTQKRNNLPKSGPNEQRKSARKGCQAFRPFTSREAEVLWAHSRQLSLCACPTDPISPCQSTHHDVPSFSFVFLCFPSFSVFSNQLLPQCAVHIRPLINFPTPCRSRFRFGYIPTPSWSLFSPITYPALAG